MKRFARLAAALALVALVGSIAAQAGNRDYLRTYGRVPVVAEGQMYNRADILPLPQDGDVFPIGNEVAQSADNFVLPSNATPGPVSGVETNRFDSTTSMRSLMNGGGFVAAGGGSVFMTAERRTERDIRKVIRSLD